MLIDLRESWPATVNRRAIIAYTNTFAMIVDGESLVYVNGANGDRSENGNVFDLPEFTIDVIHIYIRICVMCIASSMRQELK